MPRNLRTTLPRRRATPMRRYDALPREMRLWLAGAALPFSVSAVERIWHRSGRDPARALERLERAQLRALERDRAGVWGADHPGV